MTELPIFIKELCDASIIEGEAVSLEVAIENSSNCTLQWFKDDVTLTEGGRVSFVNYGDGRYSLKIQDCEDHDSGEYCCVVQNEVGKITCTGKLSIESKYKLVSPGLL